MVGMGDWPDRVNEPGILRTDPAATRTRGFRHEVQAGFAPPDRAVILHQRGRKKSL